jgi:hypothetical protein
VVTKLPCVHHCRMLWWHPTPTSTTAPIKLHINMFRRSLTDLPHAQESGEGGPINYSDAELRAI